MTTKIKLTNTPQQIVNSQNWALVTTDAGEDFNIHIGATVTDVNAFHPVREIGFSVGVSIWAWVNTSSTVYVDVSQG